MGAMQKTITPIDGSLYVERPYNSAAEIAAALAAARTAAKAWRGVPVAERARLLSKAVDAFVSHKEPIAEEITRQIGRPLGQSPGEVRGFEERARYMIEIAPGGAGRYRCRRQGRLHPLHPARAAGRRLRGGALEFPLSDRRQCRGAGADGGQCGAAEAFGPDAALRRALRRGLQGRGPAQGAVPASGADP